MAHTLAFLTCHHKDVAVKTAMLKSGFDIALYDAFNTDTLGTFTNESVRELSQIQTALKKAQMACELTGHAFGLGSEGAFGPHPQVHLLPWNYEVLAFWDAAHQHAIYAVHGTADTNYASQHITSLEEAIEFAKQSQFPNHGLIVGSPSEPFFQKGVQDADEFQQLVQKALAQHSSVWLETDMRAHMNPTRMGVIAQTADKLQALLSSHCPQCHLPGFGLTQHIAGALCKTCNSPTRLPKAEQWTCAKCEYTDSKELNTWASAAQCDVCNP
jgi:hypothetical protein